MIAVISIHIHPFESIRDNLEYHYLGILINQGARFAVPFFFVISGFFFAKKVKSVGSVYEIAARSLKRLAMVWLFFSIIYILPYNIFSVFDYGVYGPVKIIYWHVLNIIKNPVTFIFEGSSGHLWFLVSLANAVLISALFLRYWRHQPLIPLIIVSVALYVFGLLAKAYSETSIGININFNTRDGPFFSTIYFVLGYAMSEFEFAPKHFIYGLLIAVFGYSIHFCEIYYLFTTYNVSPTSHDYVVGTLFEGIGASLMALSNHPLLNIKGLSNIGKYTLGIYGIHIAFVEMLMQFDKQFTSPAWQIGNIFIVLLLSVIFTISLSKFARLKMVLM